MQGARCGKAARRDLWGAGLARGLSTRQNPFQLFDDNILAVHFADAGAQGDAGAVEILYYTPQSGIRILYGNYAWDDLDLDAVIRKLPMLKCLDSRGRLPSNPPYPFRGSLDIPAEWGYIYMGCMNHFFARDFICDRTGTFVKILKDERRGDQIFNAIAWFCGVPFQQRAAESSAIYP